MIDCSLRRFQININLGLMLAMFFCSLFARAASVDKYDPPTLKDWTNIAALPDWSGSWNPKITDQDMQQKKPIHLPGMQGRQRPSNSNTQRKLLVGPRLCL